MIEQQVLKQVRKRQCLQIIMGMYIYNIIMSASNAPAPQNPSVQTAQTGKYPTRKSLGTRSQVQMKIQETIIEQPTIRHIAEDTSSKGAENRGQKQGDNQRDLENNNSLENMESRGLFKNGVENPYRLRKSSSVDQKKQSKRPKRRKILVKQPEDFLPDFLVFIADYHYKHTIRQGWRYQAEIPEMNGNYRKVTKLVQIRQGSADFDDEVLIDFKFRFGQNRTQQQLFIVKQQLNCEWKQIPRYLEANKQVYRRVYKQKDKIQSKSTKVSY